MILDFTNKHYSSAGGAHCQESVCDGFLEEIKTSSKAPRGNALLKKFDDSSQFSEEKSEVLHELTVKGVLLVKRARPELEHGFGFLSSRVRDYMQQDLLKLEEEYYLV